MSAGNWSDLWTLIVGKLIEQASREGRERVCDVIWMPLFLQIRRQVYGLVVDQACDHLDWRRGHDA